MSITKKKLSASKLAASREYREAFVSAFLKRYIPFQIRTIRKKRGISQKQLADDAKVTQGVISRAEDPDYGNLTFNTVLRIAAGFDLAFVGKFVRFSELLKTADEMSEDSLELPSFAEECEQEDAVAIREPEPEEVFAETIVDPGAVPPVPWLGLGGDQGDQEELQRVRAIREAQTAAGVQSVLAYMAGAKSGQGLMPDFMQWNAPLRFENKDLNNFATGMTLKELALSEYKHKGIHLVAEPDQQMQRKRASASTPEITIADQDSKQTVSKPAA